MLDYLYHSVLKYQELHGQIPNLLYINRHHLQYLQRQLETQEPLALLFGKWNLKIALSPSLSHPSFARIQ
jgi:hypothetical protein